MLSKALKVIDQLLFAAGNILLSIFVAREGGQDGVSVLAYATTSALLSFSYLRLTLFAPKTDSPYIDLFQALYRGAQVAFGILLCIVYATETTALRHNTVSLAIALLIWYNQIEHKRIEFYRSPSSLTINPPALMFFLVVVSGGIAGFTIDTATSKLLPLSAIAVSFLTIHRHLKSSPSDLLTFLKYIKSTVASTSTYWAINSASIHSPAYFSATFGSEVASEFFLLRTFFNTVATVLRPLEYQHRHSSSPSILTVTRSTFIAFGLLGAISLVLILFGSSLVKLIWHLNFKMSPIVIALFLAYMTIMWFHVFLEVVYIRAKRLLALAYCRGIDLFVFSVACLILVSFDQRSIGTFVSAVTLSAFVSMVLSLFSGRSIDKRTQNER